MKFSDYLNESPAFKSGALELPPDKKPGVVVAQSGTELFNTFAKLNSRISKIPHDQQSTYRNMLNHVYLAYELLRKQYPLFFKKLD